MQIGWFGIPGTHRHTKTHIVLPGNKLACGSKLHKEMKFQYCSYFPGGYIPECDKCKQTSIYRETWRNEQILTQHKEY